MTDQIRIDVGRVSALRIRMGLTRTGLAKLCGFAPQTGVKVNRGGPVSLRTVKRLAGALGVEIHTVMAQENSETTSAVTAA